ncbi:hypothetical protein CLV24_102225 [Pontibacter ummariensis]|uniref:Uncharacterized protein n=1 Tax=Pontibacter ummariensis TaxID=1610492 RepID=A0A239BUZ4_9BACT|nr:hypothetical protein [Pontibacter ummariensis]PRY15603.1 hypothetical protein CLV24_102225 [Pontibacter ummariensis]SNS11746.1 hypothetical protein SAMN06296052_102187 [Pontibacter ummariensis]
MKNISVRILIGIIFSAIGLVSLFVAREPLTAAIWLSFGNGLILSDLRLTGKDGHGNAYVKPVPKSRMYTALFLIVLAVLLLFLQMYLDLQQG